MPPLFESRRDFTQSRLWLEARFLKLDIAHQRIEFDPSMQKPNEPVRCLSTSEYAVCSFAARTHFR